MKNPVLDKITKTNLHWKLYVLIAFVNRKLSLFLLGWYLPQQHCHNSGKNECRRNILFNEVLLSTCFAQSLHRVFILQFKYLSLENFHNRNFMNDRFFMLPLIFKPGISKGTSSLILFLWKSIILFFLMSKDSLLAL